jgi:hypothetical protein
VRGENSLEGTQDKAVPLVLEGHSHGKLHQSYFPLKNTGHCSYQREEERQFASGGMWKGDTFKLRDWKEERREKCGLYTGRDTMQKSI